jgi:uncharacterized membrane protein YhaH (DUF805 family)
MNWQYLFLRADGRIGQKDFWLGWLILFVAGIVLGMIPLLGMLISLALIYPNVCVFSKRLHDFGKTGWLAAAPYVILLVASVIAMAMGGAAMFSAMSGSAAGTAAAMTGLGLGMGIFVLAGLACLAFLLWVGLTKGDPAPNKYGPPMPSVFDSSSSTPTTPTTPSV